MLLSSRKWRRLLANIIKSNLLSVEEKINKACEISGRSREEVLLVAVSKNFPSDAILEAIKCGITDFGENRAQELRDKIQILKDEKINWHMIGNLQKNKLKYFIGKADFIHSVESFEILTEIEELSKKKENIQKVLLEINISGEESKHGMNPDDFECILEKAQDLNFIKICGLMTMAPYTQDKELIRKIFRKAKKIQEKINLKFPYFKELSMGMSNDFEIAVQEGATILRIGTSIFGEK